MAFQIIRNDITRMRVDAIVNAADPAPRAGGGTDGAIHKAAGPELLAARKKVGAISAGDAAITPAFNLPARYVIHTAGPVWRGGLLREKQQLRSCYEKALTLALKNGCKSIAFPLISAGTYGFPREKALQIATQACQEFLEEHSMDIYLVVFDRESYRLSQDLVDSVTSYIDEHYVLRAEAQTRRPRALQQQRIKREESSCDFGMVPSEPAKMALPSASLQQMLAHTDAGFSETLLKLIDKTGKKDAEIYGKAYISRQHFSKIRNNPQYKPTKATAVAFALALELDLEQTRDLIGRAGYALTRSSKFDVIIMYFIQQKNYNIADINMVLYEFDQPCLGV